MLLTAKEHKWKQPPTSHLQRRLGAGLGNIQKCSDCEVKPDPVKEISCQKETVSARMLIGDFNP